MSAPAPVPAAPPSSDLPTTAVESTVVPIILGVSLGHFLNDLMQSLIPAAYPLLKDNLSLSFAQIGLITLVFQGTASILQPLIGLYTDKRPLPYAMSAGMASTGLGLVLLAQAASFAMVLCSVAFIGLGSAIFHPEASRIARLAAGMRPGFAQAVFQVGGNTGTAVGPLVAAFVVMARGQVSIEWFAGVALLAMVLLYLVGRWYRVAGLARMRARSKRASEGQALPSSVVRLGMGLVLVLMFSKSIYSVAYSNYYTFYLMERFGLSTDWAQVFLFVFLAAVAVGTLLGGLVGDRIGRRRLIFLSIFGIVPFTLVLPYLPLWLNVPVAALVGLILASAFPALVVYAQDLLPKRTGMVAGLMFGFSFGMAAIGAAVLGQFADWYSIEVVYAFCAFLPLLGIVAYFLPEPRP